MLSLARNSCESAMRTDRIVSPRTAASRDSAALPSEWIPTGWTMSNVSRRTLPGPGWLSFLRHRMATGSGFRCLQASGSHRSLSPACCAAASKTGTPPRVSASHNPGSAGRLARRRRQGPRMQSGSGKPVRSAGRGVAALMPSVAGGWRRSRSDAAQRT